MIMIITIIIIIGVVNQNQLSFWVHSLGDTSRAPPLPHVQPFFRENGLNRTLSDGISGVAEKKGRYCGAADGSGGRTGAFPSKRWEASKRIAQAPKSNASSSLGPHLFATVFGSESGSRLSPRCHNVAATAPGLSTLATMRSLPVLYAQVVTSMAKIRLSRDARSSRYRSPFFVLGFRLGSTSRMLFSFAGLVACRFAEVVEVLAFTCATTRSRSFARGANTSRRLVRFAKGDGTLAHVVASARTSSSAVATGFCIHRAGDA